MFERVRMYAGTKVGAFVDTRESIADVNEIVKLANETGLDNIKVQDVKELLQGTNWQKSL